MRNKTHLNICKNCSISFYSYRKIASFCSIKCYREYKKNKKENIICKNCGELFMPRGREYNRKFCSFKCYGNSKRKFGKFFICKACGKKFENKRRKEHQDCCSVKCRSDYLSGENSPRYKGGCLTKSGYFIGYKNKKRISQHRRIMEEFLGRELTCKEEVHHRNGLRNDNRIENLELWTKSHPKGQRAEDQIRWAKELLLQYEPESLVKTRILLPISKEEYSNFEIFGT